MLRLLTLLLTLAPFAASFKYRSPCIYPPPPKSIIITDTDELQESIVDLCLVHWLSDLSCARLLSSAFLSAHEKVADSTDPLFYSRMPYRLKIGVELDVNVDEEIKGRRTVVDVGTAQYEVRWDDDPADWSARVCASQALDSEACASISNHVTALREGLCLQNGYEPGTDESTWIPALESFAWGTMSSCDTVFLDLGANRGDSIVKFIDAVENTKPLELYVDDDDRKGLAYTVKTLIRDRLSIDGVVRPSYCIVASEPNYSQFSENLTAVYSYASSKADLLSLRYFLIVDALCSESSSIVNFFVDSFLPDSVGSSMRFDAPDTCITLFNSLANASSPITVNGNFFKRVRSFRLSDFLRRLSGSSSSVVGDGGDSRGGRPPSHLIVKMDVEGAEYEILEELVASGAVCEAVNRGTDVTLLLETHTLLREKIKPKAPKEAIDTYVYLIERCGGKVFRDGGETD